jgi:hypothetical protein
LGSKKTVLRKRISAYFMHADRGIGGSKCCIDIILL